MSGRFNKTNGKCDVCGMENVEVLECDNSDNEYSEGHICRDCIDNILN